MSNTQCSLSGNALGWFLRLHEFYKNDWAVFVSPLKNSPQKTAYYEQVEPQALTEKNLKTDAFSRTKISTNF